MKMAAEVQHVWKGIRWVSDVGWWELIGLLIGCGKFQSLDVQIIRFYWLDTGCIWQRLPAWIHLTMAPRLNLYSGHRGWGTLVCRRVIRTTFLIRWSMRMCQCIIGNGSEFGRQKPCPVVIHSVFSTTTKESEGGIGYLVWWTHKSGVNITPIREFQSR